MSIFEWHGIDLEDLTRGSLFVHGSGDADVVDPAGAHIPEPVHETFEADRPALTVLRWSNAGIDEEERFAFRSAWLAWKAARRLRNARRP